MTAKLFSANNITKEFPGVRALDGVDFSLQAGEILGLVGENGAGKSTLMRIFGGVYPHGSYSGEFLVKDNQVRFKSPLEAEKAGIAIIHQELSTFQDLTVAENMFVGHLPTKWGLVDWDQVHSMSETWLKTVKATCRPNDVMKTLSVGTQQLVEIAKALSRKSEVLILDEPTSALSDSECTTLFNLLRQLKSEGKGLIYISHKMEEIFELCDRLVVLRDGKSVFETITKQTNEKELISHMVGRRVDQQFPEKQLYTGKAKTLLNVKNLHVISSSGRLCVDGASFQLRAGEILGLAGLLGSGRSELLKALFGDREFQINGEIELAGALKKPRSPREAIKKGIALVPEDRKRESIFPKRSLDENVSQTRLALRWPFSHINFGTEEAENERSIKDLRVKTNSRSRFIETLSGGNQQKVILGRILQSHPQVILLDEPTRGVDVGAKYEIYEILFKLASQGHGLIVVSSELPELLGISDRVGVLSHGRLVAMFDKQPFSPKEIMQYAIGTS